MKNQKSVNLNRELPPLPGLDQWKGDEEADKPKHIASLWTSKPSKRRSGDLAKSKAADLRHSREIKEVPLEQAEEQIVPVTPLTSRMAPSVTKSIPPAPATAVPTGSPSITRKPLPLTKIQSPPASKPQSPPTDSLLGDQDPYAAGRTSVKSGVEVRLPTGYHTANPSLTPPEMPTPPAAAAVLPVASPVISDIDEVETPSMPATKRRPSRLDLDETVHASPKLYDREFDQTNGETSFVSRNMSSVDEYTRLHSSKYKYADDISSLGTPPPPPVPPKDIEKKTKWPWKSKSKKQMTWMDEMEKLGVKDGVLLTDGLEGSPIVRY